MTKVFNLTKFLERRRELRKNLTETETILWSRLKNNGLGVKFRRQYGVGQYVLDFYCPKLKLAIEIDGGIHNEEEQKSYDIARQKHIETAKIKFIRFSDMDVKNNLTIVLNELERIISILKSKESPKN